MGAEVGQRASLEQAIARNAREHEGLGEVFFRRRQLPTGATDACTQLKSARHERGRHTRGLSSVDGAIEQPREEFVGTACGHHGFERHERHQGVGDVCEVLCFVLQRATDHSEQVVLFEFKFTSSKQATMTIDVFLQRSTVAKHPARMTTNESLSRCKEFKARHFGGGFA